MSFAPDMPYGVEPTYAREPQCACCGVEAVPLTRLDGYDYCATCVDPDDAAAEKAAA